MDSLIDRVRICSSLLLIALAVAAANAVVYIPADTSVGDWDETLRVFTLNTDVSDTIEITEDNLTLDGADYTIAGAGSGNGVHLHIQTDVEIRNLNVQGFTYGVLLESSSSNTVVANNLSGNLHGIALLASGGNAVTNNLIRDNSSNGIRFYNSGDNTVEDNTIEDNAYGIYLISSSSNTFSGNTVSGSSQDGIRLASSNGNTVYNNSFVANTMQAVATFSSGNIFNLDVPDGGNYWSNWTGPDADLDGFIDSPYIFSGGRDDFPWVLQDGWRSGPPIWPAGSALIASELGLTSLTLAWSPAEHDDGVIQYKIYRDDIEIDTVAGTETTYQVAGLEVDSEYIFKVEACAATGECSSDGPSIALRTLTPQEGVQELGEQVIAIDIDQRIESGLEAKLDSAERALDSDKKNSKTVGVNLLGAFINSVEAQRGKKIPQDDADALIAAAEEIIAVLTAE